MPFSRPIRIIRWLMILCLSGSLFQLGGCNPNVRSTVVAGLEQLSLTLANVLIGAAFDPLQDASSVSSLLP